MDVTVIVSTFGSPEWRELGIETAQETRENFPDIRVIQGHGETLASTRNTGAALATTEWLCFLDADDYLELGYFDAMKRATGDLRAPAVKWNRVNGNVEGPVTLSNRDPEESNPCVIGTLIRKELFESMGGFKEWWAYEDWALFLSCIRRGVVVEHVPDAVYVVNERPNSRNQNIQDEGELMYLIRKSS